MPGKHGPASDMNGDIVADHALRCAKDDDRSCLPREKTQPRMLHGAVGVRPGQFPSSRFAALGPTRETQHGAAAVFGSQGEDGHNRATARRPPSRALTAPTIALRSSVSTVSQTLPSRGQAGPCRLERSLIALIEDSQQRNAYTRPPPTFCRIADFKSANLSDAAMPSLPHFCVCLKNLKSGGG
jgi:hypothetical protein